VRKFGCPFTNDAIGGESEIGGNIHRYLSAMEALGFSGAIIVTHGEEVVVREGYGLADRETRRPYTPATVQDHGSPEDKQDITIHQLLTHSSGLTGGVGPDEEPIGAQYFLNRLMAAPLQFKPGSGYGYSNAGYSLLGMIVELPVRIGSVWVCTLSRD
jgi:CubicO group peptidase (beta-lactamase class C family)